MAETSQQPLIEQILSCPSLPSLPATAARIIELTGQEDVSMRELAETIELDQAIAAKILRTVNSSFYGLRQRCATIERALVMLGLGPVKSLALGFTIVDALSGDNSPDHPAYWERAIRTAVYAKSFAEASGLEVASEAFLGGLLQDIGMMALHQALGDEYAALISATEGDHRKLVRLELETFELQHPDIGALLAERWKLPDELIMPIKFHERPTAAPSGHTEIVRAVGLGTLAYDAATCAEPIPVMRRLYQRASEWFKLPSKDVEEVITNANEQAGDIARLFSLPAGDCRSIQEIMAEADDLLAEQAAGDGVYLGLEEMDGVNVETDPVTGLLSRESFDSGLQAVFGAAEGACEPVTVIAMATEGVEAVCGTHGQAAGDRVLTGAAAVLRKHFDPFGAIIGRISPSLITIAVRGASHPQIERVCELARVEIEAAAPRWVESPVSGVGMSIGVSTVYCGEDTDVDPTRVLGMAVRFVQAARAAGGNCIRAAAGNIAA